MRSLYVVVYNTPKFTRASQKTSKDKTISEFLQRLKNHKVWHYDIGDDPSFYQFNQGKNLTWGICRTNIRNRLKKDDVVLFFCFCKDCFAYYLTGYATVDNIIKQSEIWQKKEYKLYRNYFNILIKPDGSKTRWIHSEILADITGDHPDWLKRLIVSKGPNKLFALDKDTIKVAFTERNNYIIFKQDSADTFILKNQIKIATWEPKDKKEVWLESDLSNKIYEFSFNLSNHSKYEIVSQTNRNSLRVHDRNQSHVFIKYELEIDGLAQWKKDFKEYLEQNE